MGKRKRFMSYKKKVIFYEKLDDCTMCYMVAKGDGTDEYFIDWRDAIAYIDKIENRRNYERA